jgi:hypothetical protein
MAYVRLEQVQVLMSHDEADAIFAKLREHVGQCQRGEARRNRSLTRLQPGSECLRRHPGIKKQDQGSNQNECSDRGFQQFLFRDRRALPESRAQRSLSC